MRCPFPVCCHAQQTGNGRGDLRPSLPTGSRQFFSTTAFIKMKLRQAWPMAARIFMIPSAASRPCMNSANRQKRNSAPSLRSTNVLKGRLMDNQAAAVLPEVLIEPAEKQLNALLDKQQTAFKQAIDKRDYHQAYTLIATLQPALAELFEKVKILADDPKSAKIVSRCSSAFSISSNRCSTSAKSRKNKYQ